MVFLSPCLKRTRVIVHTCIMGALIVGTATAVAESHIPKELMPVLGPKSNFVLYCNAEKMREADFADAWQRLFQKIQKEGPPGASLEERMPDQIRWKKLQEKLNIDKDDIRHFVLAADLDGVDKQTVKNPAHPLHVASGIVCKKSIDRQAIFTVLEEVASEEGDNTAVEKRSYHKQSVLVITSQDQRPLWLAFPSNKVVFAGTKEGVTRILDEQAAESKGSESQLPDELAQALRSIQTRSQFGIAFIPTRSLRELLKESAEDMENRKAGDSSHGQGMRSRALQALSQLRHGTWGVNFGEKADIRADFAFSSAEAAKNVDNLLENSLISMAKIFLVQATSEPLPLLGTMQSSLMGETTVRFTMSITNEDLDIIRATVADQ